MGDKSKIEWTDASWNPVRARFWQIQDDGGGKERIGWHCVHASDGCRFCYAERINKRFGTVRDYHADEQFREERVGYRNGEVKTFLDEKMLTQPLRWRRPRMIFAGSMTDLFGDWVTDDTLDRIFAVMALCPQHIFQALTKRAERMREYLASLGREHWLPPRLIEAANEICRAFPDAEERFDDEPPEWPLPNVWLGVSVEDQRRADERIPELLATPAAVRFVSYEPALGPVDFTRIVVPRVYGSARCNSLTGETHDHLGHQLWHKPTDRLDWIIAGGESGPGARPFNTAWAQAVIDQCWAAAVPCFVKQLGARPYSQSRIVDPAHARGETLATALPLRDQKGADPLEWPEDLRVREYPVPV